MELVKEHPNPFENESLSQSVHLQQLLGLAVQSQPPLPLPPPTTSSITSITPNLNDLTKMLSIINNATTSPPSPSTPSSSSSSSANFVPRPCTETPSKNCLNTCNDDSLDSQAASCNGGDDVSSKTRYRRRKPQKTIRMSNELNEIDAAAGPLENERTNATKHEHNSTKHDINHSNGLNFQTFHSDANSIAPAGMRPPQTQTHSMDLSHHCGSAELFENGLVNYSKSNASLDLTHAQSIGDGHCSATKSLSNTKAGNLMPADEMNGLNLFGGVNFGHLRGTNLTNEIATFPNTDDLVKKVEELVKCNEQNGFGASDFGPMELIKSQANKLTTDTFETTRLPNGLLDPIKMPTNAEHSNNHAETAKHNGNGLLSGIAQTNQIATIANSHDGVDSASTVKTLSNGAHPERSMPNRNGGIKPAHLDEKSTSEFASIGPVTDMMYEKMSEEIAKNQSNLNKNFAANAPRQENSTSYNRNNELNKDTLSASSSDGSPSNPSSLATNTTTPPTPASAPATSTSNKANTNNPTNKKNNNASNRSSSSKTAGNKSQAAKKTPNQKNSKTKDKSDKKSDIKKTKWTGDDSAPASTSSSSTTTTTATTAAAETLNKLRGPYVHVSRDGTLEVINAPLNEEVSEKQNKLKKTFITQRPADRNRIRGLHVSTLSNKYDAITTDISWMCVFCKLGPHKFGLGDLFGPFILTTDGENFQLAQIDPKDDIFGRQQKLIASAAKSMSPKSATAGNVSVLLFAKN